MHLNAKGLTRAKSDVFRKVFMDADVLALQEIHVTSDKVSRLRVRGFNMVDYKGHGKYWLAIYASQNVRGKNINPNAGNEHSNSLFVGNLIIYNV